MTSFIQIAGLLIATVSSSTMPKGLNIDSSSTTVQKTVQNTLKVKTVKFYYGTDGSKVSDGMMSRIKLYKNADITVTLVMKKKSDTSKLSSFLKALTARPEFKYVARWELGNESESKTYWDGTSAEFASKFFIPAAQKIRAAGGKVVTPGPAWDPEKIAAFNKNGVISNADYIGYHAYRGSASQLQSAITRIKQISSKPIVVTEWTCRGQSQKGNSKYKKNGKTQPMNWDAKKSDGSYFYPTTDSLPADVRAAWANCSGGFWKVLNANTYRAYYFKETASTSMAGRGSVLKADGKSPNGEFYNMFVKGN